MLNLLTIMLCMSCLLCNRYVKQTLPVQSMHILSQDRQQGRTQNITAALLIDVQLDLTWQVVVMCIVVTCVVIYIYGRTVTMQMG